MKLHSIALLCLMVAKLTNQPPNISFESLMKNFEKEYSELKIPELELSYVNNLKNVSSIDDLEKQKKVFKNYQALLQEYSIHNLSEDEQMTQAVVSYEIEVNLVRIELEKKWLANNYGIEGTRIFNEYLGKEWYAYFLKKWIDKDLTPDAAFKFGLKEIEQVKLKMKTIQKSLDLDDANFKQQWNNTSHSISDNDEILEKYHALKVTVREKAKAYFPDVDKVPLVHIEAGNNENLAIAPAYYNNNTFYYNFFDNAYDSRQLGWIFLHEAIPGHHYQLSLDRQLGASVRQLFFYMSYAEGWGAYIEQYGNELGAYNSPFDSYSQLEWDLIRSVRVALDVGLNYYGWTDEKAMAFWNQHIPYKEDIAKRELKRMKRWPAQVITYKYGKHILDELKGDKSTPQELKAFHKQVLEFGDIPLSVLQHHIQKQQ